VIIRRLIVPLTMAVIAVHTTPVRAQSALPGAAAVPSNEPAFPPVSGGFAPSRQAGPPAGEDCMYGFLPLREEAEKRGAMIKKADSHATPDQACKLFVAYGQSELKMIRYIESHQAKCGIPPQVGEQLRSGRKNTEVIQKKVCDAARQQRPAGPSLDLQPIGPFAARDHGLPLAVR
jgi:hypothetical protein